MKLIFKEFDHDFYLNFVAEDMQEAALLVRFGMNATKELRHTSTSVESSGHFSANISIGKRKNASGYINKNK
jgi:hypothetical protein